MRNLTILALVAALILVGCDPKPKAQVQGPMAPGPGVEPLQPPSDRDDVYDPYANDNTTTGGYDRYDADRPFPDDGYSSTTISEPTYSPTYTPPAYTPPASTAPTYTPPAYTPPAYTPPAPTPPPAPLAQTHVIQKGDTLWAISTRYLGSGRRWKEILAVNPGLNPRKLTIGKELKIPSR